MDPKTPIQIFLADDEPTFIVSLPGETDTASSSSINGRRVTPLVFDYRDRFNYRRLDPQKATFSTDYKTHKTHKSTLLNNLSLFEDALASFFPREGKL